MGGTSVSDSGIGSRLRALRKAKGLSQQVGRGRVVRHGRGLVVLDDGEVAEDLVSDMVEVLTSLYARLYGRGSAKNRARKALQAAEHG